MVYLRRYSFLGRRSRLSTLFFRLSLLFFILLVLFLLWIEVIIKPIFFEVARTEALRLANKAIYEVVEEEVYLLAYEDLIYCRENQAGEIVMLQVDHHQVARLISTLTIKLQKKLDEIAEKGFSLPLAQLFGIQVLAGFGPRIPVKLIPLGVADATHIHDIFEAVGINQTRHRIYVELNPKLRIIVPFMEREVEVKAKVPVTEVTIMGRVPEVYLHMDGGLFGVP